MNSRARKPKPGGPPKWWETMAGAPLAYFMILGALFGALFLLKKLLMT